MSGQIELDLASGGHPQAEARAGSRKLGIERSVRSEAVLPGSVDDRLPVTVAMRRERFSGQTKWHRVVMRIEQHHEVVVDDPLSASVDFRQRASRQVNAKAAREILAPFLGGHFGAVGLEPDDVLGLLAMKRPTLKEMASPEH